MPHMEDALDLPLRVILPQMQARIVYDTRYFGVPTLKNPLDFWIYQELLFAERPDFIVEIGNRYGGSTLAFAHLCDLLGHGQVIGLDIDHSDVPAVVRAHPRITLIESDACAAFAQVRAMIPQGARAFVIEDSSHTFDNTLAVLRTYAELVPPGGSFVVEDGICHHGLEVGPDPGPYEAVAAFLAEEPRFVADRSREGFLITWNPNGYLRRIA